MPPLLTLKDEVIQLWLCGNFIPAFHFVHGYDHGQQKARFQQVLDSGYLRPAAEVGAQNMYILDVLAGDDNNVFLSAVRPAQGMGGGTNFGFIFNALDLIQRGALLNEHDLLRDYEHATQEVAGRYYYSDSAHSASIYGRQRNTPEDRERFLSYQPWSSTGGGRAPAIREFLPEIVAALVAVQNKSRFVGDEAARELSLWAGKICGDANTLLDMAKSHVESQSEAFRKWYANAMQRWHGKRRPRREACASAARNTVAGEQLIHEVMFNSPPELLWPGRLPLDLAVAAFAIPSRHHGFSWPDDLFRLACYGTEA